MLKAFALLFLLAVVGCSGPNQAKITNNPTPGPEKGSGPDQQISSLDDQLKLSFSELGWNRDATTLAVKPPTLVTRDGCATETPTPNFLKFLTVSYICSRTSDNFDRQPNRRFEFSGTEFFSSTGSEITVESPSLLTKVSRADSGEITAIGEMVRKMSLRLPAPSSHTYAAGSTTTFMSSASKGKGHIGESWASEFNGAFEVGASTLLDAGSSIKISHVPGSEIPNAVTTPSVTTLTAQSNIYYFARGACARPVGSFRFDVGEGEQAKVLTVTANADGYVRSDVLGLHPWGPRCREQ